MKRSSGRLKFLSHWAKFNINFDSPKVLSIYQPNNYHVPKINKFPRFIFAFWSHQRSIAHNVSTKFCEFYRQNCGRKSFPILVYFYIQNSIIFSHFISPFFCATSVKGTYRELRKVESSYKLNANFKPLPPIHSWRSSQSTLATHDSFFNIFNSHMKDLTCAICNI